MTAPQTVFLFSGQGSHYFHMGRELFEGEPTFRHLMLDMDAMVRERIGQSVLAAVYDPARNKADPFERLLFTHPAIFMVEYALAKTLIARGVKPDCTLGASLGIFAAMAIAGRVTLDAALNAVLKQAQDIEAGCQLGGMIAVLAESKLYAEDELRGRSEIAAENFSSHFVLAAPKDQLAPIESHLTRRGLTFQRLAVPYAFHSRWIEDVKGSLLPAADMLQWKAAEIPVACCAQAGFIGEIPAGYLWTVARAPIQFARTIEYLERNGPYIYIDVGPAGSLATFLRYIVAGKSVSQVKSVLTPFGRDLKNLEMVQSKLG